MPPRYPEIRVRSRSRNPLALVAAIREELRRRRAGRDEIRRFSSEALAARDPGAMLAVCRGWAEVQEQGR